MTGHRERAEVLAELVARLGRPDDPLGRQAREIAAREGSLSPAMADRVLAVTCRRYTPDALAALPAGEARGRRVAVVLSASVATAPIRAIVAPLAAGAASLLVRPSRRQPALAALLTGALAAAGLPIASGPTERDAFLEHAIASGVELVVAYGLDETIAAIDAALPSSVGFEGRGHGFGLAYVARDATDSDEAARAVALDIADYDQHGCLSPRMVLVEAEAAPFAERLHRALGELARALPRGPLDAALAARILQWQGASAAAVERFWRGSEHAVAAYAQARTADSPGGRNVAVVPVRDPSEAGALLGDRRRFVTTVGLGGQAQPGNALARAFPGARIVPAGTVQDPPLDGPEDPRPPIRHRPPP